MSRMLKTAEWFHADGFPIAIERREPQEPFGRHAHEFSEIAIITAGSGLHGVGKETWPLTAGDVFVISGPRTHEYRDLADLRLINVLFQPRVLRFDRLDVASLPGYHALFSPDPVRRKPYPFRSRLHLPPKELGAVLGLVDQLEQEITERAPGFAFMATALFLQLVGQLARNYSRTRSADARALLRIAQAISRLETQYDRPVNLDELASLAHMSKRSFLRAFAAATGSTPIAYLIQLRITHAAALLRQTDASITEVAFQVGFSDSNYFTRQFRKVTGHAPRHYRRRAAADVSSAQPRDPARPGG